MVEVVTLANPSDRTYLPSLNEPAGPMGLLRFSLPEGAGALAPGPGLETGEIIQVDTGSIVAFDEGVDYDIQLVGGIKTAIFGGEGLFLATLTGPGRVVVQSMTLEKMRRELIPLRTGGDEHKGLGALQGFFDSDD